MRTASEVAQILLAEKAEDRRLRTFLALLAAESGLGTHGMTVVGGSALEIYTKGAYVSGDIDVLVADRGKATRILAAWGFKDEGKLWTNDQLQLFVDLMEREITGSKRLTRIVQTKYGAVRLAAPEDLILKRLREARYWRQRTALAQAILLATQYGPDLDWSYVDGHAERDGLVDLVSELRRRAGLR